MATLSDVQSNVADMLRGRTDLNDQIKAEIQNAIRHYNRRASWVTERRGGEVATVAGTAWYSSIDNTTGHGVEDSPSGTTPTTTDDLRDLVKVIYAKLEQGTIDWPLDLISYKQYEALSESNTVQGTPRYLTHFAGKVALWPVPNAVYTLYLSGYFKPAVPSASTDESVWFDQYLELIENSTARRVSSRWLHDLELANTFRALEDEQERLLLAEGAARTTTGRLKPHA